MTQGRGIHPESVSKQFDWGLPSQQANRAGDVLITEDREHSRSVLRAVPHEGSLKNCEKLIQVELTTEWGKLDFIFYFQIRALLLMPVALLRKDLVIPDV